MSPMDDRKPSVKCPCGQSVPLTDDQLFKDVVCPSCGKTVLGAPASSKAAGSPAPKAAPPEKAEAAAQAPAAPRPAPPAKADTGPKTDPFAPKGDTTKASGTPSPGRKPPLFAKD